MFFHEHNPPHFHARYGDHWAVIDIRNLGVLEGSIPARALGLVIEWASQHRQELERNWELASQKKPLKEITPLV